MILLLAAMSGCGKEYEQKKLGKDSPEGQRVAAMVQAMRQAGEKGVDETLSKQAAGGLTDPQRQSLRAALMELIQAASVELDRFDQFGPQVYRATFRLSSGGASRTAAFLLVSQGAELRWAGRN